MKKACIVLSLFVCAATVQARELPKTMGASSGGEEVSFKVNKADKTVTITAPLTKGQQTTEKSAEKITDSSSVSLCVSCYAKLSADGSRWIPLAAPDEYCGTSVAAGKDNVQRTVKYPAEGEVFISRVWGKSSDEKHLWINQGSEFNRLSSTDKPGYEFVVDFADGTVQSVPKELPARP